MHSARALDINLLEQPHLAFVAELALCIELPAGWELVPGEKGAPVNYRHVVSNVTTARHPLASYAASLSISHPS